MKIKLFTIPNLLTLANLLCGSVAAVAALVWGELTLAFGLVVLAAVFDFFDGFVARLLHQSSPIGLQLDSLADDVSFGFAPAAVMFALYGQMSGVWLPDGEAGLVVFLFTACGALRWPGSTSMTRSAPSSSDCPSRPPRCFVPRSACWPRPTAWRSPAR